MSRRVKKNLNFKQFVSYRLLDEWLGLLIIKWNDKEKNNWLSEKWIRNLLQIWCRCFIIQLAEVRSRKRKNQLEKHYTFLLFWFSSFCLLSSFVRGTIAWTKKWRPFWNSWYRIIRASIIYQNLYGYGVYGVMMNYCNNIGMTLSI